MDKGVTVLIPTYWANNMLSNCIMSLTAACPDVQLMVYKNDIGWLRACNKMMQSVNTDIILLNDDTIILSDIVAAMRDLAYTSGSIGIVGGKSLAPDQEHITNYGIYVGADGNTAHKYFGKPRDSVGVERQQAVEGSLFYIKREVIDRIGLLDEIYTMGYRAEVDYCFRAAEAGYSTVSTPYAEYIHLVSQTSGPLGIANDTFDVFMQRWGRKLKQGMLK